MSEIDNEAASRHVADLEPEQVSATQAARMAGVSQATWWRLHAAGKVPRPNKLGGRTLWQVNGHNGLREWIRQGCPARAEFEARQKAQHYAQTQNREISRI
jgi:predicted DNA-binding transcriptional regulator AlpA